MHIEGAGAGKSVPGTGLGLKDIQEHLYDMIDGLHEHEFSINSTARLMVPPNKARKSAQYYKSLVEARLGRKKNGLEGHRPIIDISIVREFA